MLQGFAIDADLDSRPHGLDLPRIVGRVIELAIVDTGGLAAADMAVLLQLDGDHIRVHHGVAGDVKRLLERKLLDRYPQRQ